MYLSTEAGVSPRILSEGHVVGSVANLPPNTLKIGKDTFSNLGASPSFSLRGTRPPSPASDAHKQRSGLISN